MISCRDWWPRTKPGCFTMTRRQSNNQWSGGIAAHPAPKIPSVKNPLENFSPRFFLDQDGILLTDYLLKGQTIHADYYSIEGHFEGKTPREGHQGGLVLAGQCPGSPGTWNPQETGLPGLPVSWSPTLFSGSGPVGLPPVPWTEKNNWKVAIFHPTRRSFLPRRPGWTDNFWIFFEWLAKVRATG